MLCVCVSFICVTYMYEFHPRTLGTFCSNLGGSGRWELCQLVQKCVLIITASVGKLGWLGHAAPACFHPGLCPPLAAGR